MAGTKSISIQIAFAGLVAGILYLSALKSREALGADNLARTEGISWEDCLDGASGSIACGAKQAVKLYVFNIRGSYVEKARQRAYEIALNKGISEGLPINAAREKATKSGKDQAKLASRNHKRITGPIIAGTWDFFEVLYFTGTFVEGLVKGAGSMAGTYFGGMVGEQNLSWASSRVGYLAGSHIGSWLGGEVGLLIYDVCNGARLLTLSLLGDSSGGEIPEDAMVTEDGFVDEQEGFVDEAIANSDSDYFNAMEYQ